MSISTRYLLVFLTAFLVVTGCATTRSKMPPIEPKESPQGEPGDILEEFWPDGSIRIRREVIRGEDGLPIDHGVYTRWHKNGLPEYETVYDHGRMNGRAIRWHMNGEKWIEELYVQGLKEGASRTWNEAGELVKEEQYAHGKPHGTWTVWKKGVVRARSCFDHGAPVDCEPETAPE
jgi:hypothetical protein